MAGGGKEKIGEKDRKEMERQEETHTRRREIDRHRVKERDPERRKIV